MLIDVHSHYMPKELSRALEKRVEAPRIFRREGKSFIEYGAGSITQLTPVFFEPEQILERMDEAGIVWGSTISVPSEGPIDRRV